MRVAVVGASGQLGCDVVLAARAAGHTALALTHDDVDISDVGTVRNALADCRADAVVNCAAMSHVESCERDPEGALVINGAGARNLAVASAELNAKLVQISTDYVFDGTKGRPYVESDAPRPLNAYGTSKLAGEYFVTALQPRHFVVRTSALYGVNPCRGKPQDNFVRTMLSLAKTRDEVAVVDDQRITPTWTSDLARQIVALAETTHYGVYHATSQGECSWLEFARAVFEIAGLDVRLIPRRTEKEAELRRPPSSVLENAALKQIGLDLMPPWRRSLTVYLETIGAAAPAARGV